MPKAKHLTKTTIDALKPAANRYEQPDLGERGLYLVVQPSGHKSWALRYKIDGRSRKLTIQEYPVFGVDEARRAARAAKDSAKKGLDPAEQKKERLAEQKAARETDIDTFAGVARLFIFRHAQPNNKGWKEQARLLGITRDPAKPDDHEDPRTFIAKPGSPAAILSRKPFEKLTARDVHSVIEVIVDRGAPIASNKVLATMHKMFDWAIRRPDIGLDKNPAANIERQPENERERVLKPQEIVLVWRAAEAVGYPFGPLVQLLLLTAQRLREVGGIVTSELSDGGTLWTLPAARAKNKVMNEIFLSSQAQRIIAALPSPESKAGYLFTTTGKTAVSGFSKAKKTLDAKMLELLRKDIVEAGGDPTGAKIDHWTFHDLRRTASTLMADEVGVAPHILEAVLNHVSGHKGGVAGLYNRAKYAKPKAEAWRAWAGHLETIVTGKQPETNVVVLRELA